MSRYFLKINTKIIDFLNYFKKFFTVFWVSFGFYKLRVSESIEKEIKNIYSFL